MKFYMKYVRGGLCPPFSVKCGLKRCHDMYCRFDGRNLAKGVKSLVYKSRFGGIPWLHNAPRCNLCSFLAFPPRKLDDDTDDRGFVVRHFIAKPNDLSALLKA